MGYRFDETFLHALRACRVFVTMTLTGMYSNRSDSTPQLNRDSDLGSLWTVTGRDGFAVGG